MALCNDHICNCAITSETLTVTGSGTPGDPWVVEQVEFSDLTELEEDVANIVATLETLPSTYVDTVGDAMSGRLFIIAPVEELSLSRSGADGAHIGFYTQDGFTTRTAFIQSLTTALGISHTDAVRFITNSVERARYDNAGALLVNKTAAAIATLGCELRGNTGVIVSTVSGAGNANYFANRISAADANGQLFCNFASTGTTIGSITRATASTVAFNTSSDERLKENIREVDDELALFWLRQAQPMLFEFSATPGDAHVGYIAQRLAAAWPESIALGIVTPGELEDGGWQIDYSKFTPLIHAALRAVDRQQQDLLARVEALEAASA